MASRSRRMDDGRPRPFSSALPPKTAASLKNPSYGRSLALEAAGFNVWREQTRLETHTGAADWSRPRRAREIAFALADCDVVCLRWSQHAAASK